MADQRKRHNTVSTCKVGALRACVCRNNLPRGAWVNSILKRRCKIIEKCFRFDSSYVLSYWKINSFSEDSTLRNIDTGVDVNVREVETRRIKFLLRERVVSGSSHSRKLISERISTQKIFFEKPRTTTTSDGPDDSVSIYAQFVLELGSLLPRL